MTTGPRSSDRVTRAVGSIRTAPWMLAWSSVVGSIEASSLSRTRRLLSRTAARSPWQGRHPSTRLTREGGEVGAHPAAEERAALLDEHRVVAEELLAHLQGAAERRVPFLVADMHGPVAPVPDRMLERGRRVRVGEDCCLPHACGPKRLKVVEQQRSIADGEELFRPRAR